ncbi:MAG: 4-alpha-glucanotransferase [Chloroflexi bacterium]|nr:4-alpha-glucanotransferase [Chloroflexota bacterium]
MTFPALSRLARLYGVFDSYVGLGGRRHAPQPETVFSALQALGAPLETPNDVPSAIAARRRELWSRLLEPVVVAREGHPLNVGVRAPTRNASPMAFELTLEDGRAHRWTVAPDALPLGERVDLDGETMGQRRVKLPEILPVGYHRLRLDLGSRSAEARIIAAPRRAYVAGGRSWGAFAPAYAIHSARTWGIGDLGDMERLAHSLANQGARFLGTTPFLATFEDEPFDPSPYSPASRLFWNELYLDLDQVPGLNASAEAAGLLRSPAVHDLLARSRGSPEAEYQPVMSAKRAILEAVAEDFFRRENPLREEFEGFSAARPQVREYARFRAVREHEGRPWQAGAGGGEGRGDEHYHQFVQWLMDRQLAAFADRASARGMSLYFDLPIGARRDGFDAWKYHELFALESSIGAPPDPGFPSGQNWALPPIRPDASRLQGHEYFIETVRHQMRYAGMLRVDHVMGLHRLFWIPPGSGEGVYVRYPEEEYLAILRLESHRNQCTVVGEDLGTVPPGIRAALGRDGFQRLYVLQLELLERTAPLLAAPRASVASLNTHDMPPFATFWNEAGDSAWRTLAGALYRLGFLADPDPDLPTMLRASLAALAASPARFVMLNLEDLWLETRRQNLPGTVSEANWRHKHSLSLEAIAGNPEVQTLLGLVQSARSPSVGPAEKVPAMRGKARHSSRPGTDSSPDSE